MHDLAVGFGIYKPFNKNRKKRRPTGPSTNQPRERNLRGEIKTISRVNRGRAGRRKAGSRNASRGRAGRRTPARKESRRTRTIVRQISSRSIGRCRKIGGPSKSQDSSLSKSSRNAGRTISKAVSTKLRAIRRIKRGEPGLSTQVIILLGFTKGQSL